jgi:phage baseplate assembly protein W
MMNRSTGRAMDEAEHIRQSIHDILTTPVGSRIMRREYGSLIPSLIDHPSNEANRLRLMAASAMAIVRWEPRVQINAATLSLAMDGRVQIDIDATRRTGQRAGRQLNVSVPLQ